MKKVTAVALSAMMLTGTLIGCGEAGMPTPTPPATDATPSVLSAGKKDVVRFALDWTPNTNHTGLYVAQEKGWYAEAGIDLQILPYSAASTPATLVSLGRADFGVSFEEEVVQARADKLPIKSVAAVLQTNTSALVTLKGSGLDRPAQLEGKRYAGFGSPYEEPVISTVIKSDGAATGKFSNITTNLFGYQALAARQTDFVWIFLGWEGLQAKQEKVELNTFLLKDYGVPDYYTPVIMANESFLTNQPDVARRFISATAKGYEYGVTNPTEAADLLVKGAPAGTFVDANLPRESQAYLAPHYKGSQAKWGVQSLEYWTNYPRFIAQTGLLKNGDGKVITPEELDYAAMFTNEYLP